MMGSIVAELVDNKLKGTLSVNDTLSEQYIYNPFTFDDYVGDNPYPSSNNRLHFSVKIRNASDTDDCYELNGYYPPLED